jgi:hypothetical protein
LGSNIGADEKAAPTVVSGALVAAQDALGIDYNNDGRGIGFNPSSLLGIVSVPPYLHNGAAENLFSVVSDVKHRTANGRLPDRLTNPADQISLFAFLETLDTKTVPFVTLDIRASGNQVIIGFDSVNGVVYGIEGRTTLTGPTSILTSVNGTGARIEVTLPNNTTTRFLRLVAP